VYSLSSSTTLFISFTPLHKTSWWFSPVLHAKPHTSLYWRKNLWSWWCLPLLSCLFNSLFDPLCRA
jgi:hypothetical protein